MSKTTRNEQAAPAAGIPVKRMVSRHLRQRPPYGSKWSLLHGEAYRIWLTSMDEICPSPEFGMLNLMVSEGYELESLVALVEIWRIADNILTTQQLAVLRYRFLRDFTLKEVAQRMFVTRERVRQIECKAIRRLQRVLLA